jgi:rod shape-determining protein MreD
MIITWRIGLRLAAIVFFAVLLQVSFFSYLSILGATPDILPVVVTAIGLLGGALAGAVLGFVAGLLLDSVLLQTLGASSLALLAVGYLAGRWRELFEVRRRFEPALLAAALTMLGTTIFAGLQLMLGVDTSVSLLVVREILVKSLLAFLLALPLFPLIRFVLRPALVDAPERGGFLARRRRRRASRRARTRRPRVPEAYSSEGIA